MANNYEETFILEARNLLEVIEETVLEIEKDPRDNDAINRLFRCMHTIKGSGAMFGFDNIAGFTHHVETALDAVRRGELAISKALINLVLASRDQIALMLESEEADIVESGRIIHELQRLCGITPAAVDNSPQATTAPDAPATWRIRFEPEPALLKRGLDPVRIIRELRGLGDCEVKGYSERVPPLSRLAAEDCCLAWDIVLRTRKPREAIDDVFLFVSDESRVRIERIGTGETATENVPRLGEILVDKGDADPAAVAAAAGTQKKLGEILIEKGVASPEHVDAALKEQQLLSRQAKSGTIGSVRVPFDKLDNLVNLVGELVTNQARLHQVAGRLDDSELSGTSEDVQRLTNALRDSVLNIRMMPIGNIFSKFRRVVRDLAEELGKEVDLVTEGGEAELDKTVLEKLDEPLVHLIRNAVDHGIDSAAARLAAGKPRQGTIRLAAEHRGATVAIVIEDDGAGLDRDEIRRHALGKGLLRENEQLPDGELFALIFEPGFSTKTQVTNVSGRGVGMDVVKRTIDSLRGTIEITSKPGAGTTITLSLPLTLAIIDGFLVESAGDRFILPLAMVTGCLELTVEERNESGGARVMTVRGRQMPYVRLREEFSIAGAVPDLEHVVTVEAEGEHLGIVVDRILGDHQAVIKSLGGLHETMDGVSGATIMGDGRVALIVDIPGMVKQARLERQQVFESRQKE